jgi:peptidoglycan/xylan/chitin deacetylase (PgdA/CDA1 family)
MLHRLADLPRRIASRAIRTYQRKSRRGIVLMFHEIYADNDALARAFGSGATTALLEAVIVHLRKTGWSILSLDAALARLDEAGRAPPFAVLTFDDGYRDTLSQALPVLQRYRAPFTLYVPTGAVTRELPAWWLALRTLFQSRERVDIAAMGATFECPDLDGRQRGYAAVRDWVHQDYARARLLEPTFQAYGISLPAVNDACFMDEDSLRSLARNSLATIGAHTATHTALSALSAADAERELTGNRDYLQGLLDRPVSHLAYPYGGARACGAREFAMAAALGFQSAVTTRFGAVADAHRARRHQIPRVGASGTMQHLEYFAEAIAQL